MEIFVIPLTLKAGLGKRTNPRTGRHSGISIDLIGRDLCRANTALRRKLHVSLYTVNLALATNNSNPLIDRLQLQNIIQAIYQLASLRYLLPPLSPLPDNRVG